MLHFDDPKGERWVADIGPDEIRIATSVASWITNFWPPSRYEYYLSLYEKGERPGSAIPAMHHDDACYWLAEVLRVAIKMRALAEGSGDRKNA